MRKKCGNCGLICFMSDETCKRCGSQQFVIDPDPNESQAKESHLKPLSFWSYLKYFLLAVLIEVVALASFIPALGEQMMRHSSNAPRPSGEIVSEWVAFILHLPTVLVTFPLAILTYTFIMLLTPLTQIIFFTCLFAYIARRRRMKSK
jgi:hypothetical protein